MQVEGSLCNKNRYICVNDTPYRSKGHFSLAIPFYVNCFGSSDSTLSLLTMVLRFVIHSIWFSALLYKLLALVIAALNKLFLFQ
jgi:uncharacterized membrane protein